MATNYERFVDPDADAGGDGTTSALTGANCAFKSISLAEAAGGSGSQPPLDLTAAGDTYTITCGSASGTHTADSTGVTFDGWTTSATSYLLVRADSSNRASTAWSASKYRLETNSQCVDIGATTDGGQYYFFDGLQMKSTGSGARVWRNSNSTYNTNCRISNCHLRQSYATGTQYCIYLDTNSGTTRIWNCIMVTTSGYGLRILAGTADVYSCTAIVLNGTASAYNRSGGTLRTKNCYGYSAGGNDFSGSIADTNCASGDTTADGTNPQTNVAYSTSSGAYFADITAGAEDLSIASTSSTLYGNGTVTSGESAPLNFTTDINGETRGASWDIGADEYVAPPPSGALLRPSSMTGGMSAFGMMD